MLVESVVTYVKTRRHGNSNQSEVVDVLDDDAEESARKRQKSVFSRFSLLILANHNGQA
jgi:hypothetical protein